MELGQKRLVRPAACGGRSGCQGGRQARIGMALALLPTLLPTLLPSACSAEFNGFLQGLGLVAQAHEIQVRAGTRRAGG